MDESIHAAIVKIQNQIADLEGQVVLKKKMVNQLCEMENEHPIYTDQDLISQEIKTSKFRPDQFYGRPLATAVKEILERRLALNLGAISLNELFDTMKAGGFAFDNSNEQIAKRNLAITLAKNPAFTKVPSNGHIGLAEWYPNIKKKREDKSEDTESSAEKIEEKIPAK